MTVSADTPACLHYAALVLPFQGAPRIALALNSCKSYFFCIQTQLAVQVLRIWFLLLSLLSRFPNLHWCLSMHAASALTTQRYQLSLAELVVRNVQQLDRSLQST